MIYYGEASRDVDPRAHLDAVAEALAEAERAGLAIARHAALVEALILAGEAAQGLADAALERDGAEATGGPPRAAMGLVHGLAHSVVRSWHGLPRQHAISQQRDVAPPPRPGAVRHGLETLRAQSLPGRVAVRPPEGFAHYAVYPESYALAAAASGLPPSTRVIGIRSVGTTLGAMVAAALGAAVPFTLRPVGHPFRREVRPGPRLDAALRASHETLGLSAPWAIVDEGPGLSGSSFGAVADMLFRYGMEPGALTFFPSHAGLPGPEASPAHRALWAGVRRRPADTDAVLGAGGPMGIAHWVEDLVGPPLAPPEDVAGGRWRQGRHGPPELWPPSDGQNERRKFVVRGERGTVLMKFAGLGAAGRGARARAKVLAEAGFTLPPLALRHGFLVEPWRDDLAPLRPGRLDRAAFLPHLARYIGMRARRLPAPPGGGATAEALFAMLEANAREALGPAAAEAFGAWAPRLAALGAAIRRVETDNRLQAWEWLEDGRGGWLKTDAVDHCAGHDLVGCQDVAWDVAGAATEFALSAAEEGALCDGVARAAGRRPDAMLVAFCRPAYAAFQLGACRLAADRAPHPERARLEREARRYAERLENEAFAGIPATFGL